jgi:hypothetical protein
VDHGAVTRYLRVRGRVCENQKKGSTTKLELVADRIVAWVSIAGCLWSVKPDTT